MKKSKCLLAGTAFALLFAGTTNVFAAGTVNVDNLNDLEGCLKIEGNICVLQDNFKVEKEIEITSNTATLDLNDNKLDLATGCLRVSGTGNLTVVDSGAKKEGLISADGKKTIEVIKGGTLAVNGGTIYNTYLNDGAAVRTWGTEVDSTLKTRVTIGVAATLAGNTGFAVLWDDQIGSYGVVVDIHGNIIGRPIEESKTENGHAAIQINGKIKTTTGNVPIINIYDTAVIGGIEGNSGNANNDAAPGIYAAGYAKVNIKGGMITGTEALSIKSGEFDITGGKFVATGKFTDSVTANGSGTEATGAAISITNNNAYAKNVKLSITGKNVVVASQNGYAIYEGDSTENKGTAVKEMSITAGTFGGNENVGAVYAKTIEEFITGGEYTSPLKAEYLPVTLGVVKNEDGDYVIENAKSITVVKSENGTIEVPKSSVPGQLVTIKVVATDGYMLKSISGVNVVKVDDKTYTFSMPESDVTLTSVFEKAPVDTTIKENETNPNTFDGIMLYISLAVVSIIGLIGTRVYKLKSIK